MTRNRDKYLYDMLDACKFLIDLTADETIDRFVRDRVFRGAVERELQNIGEALMQLKKLDPACAERITEHERIIGFRHVLVHGYDVLDGELVWYVVSHKLSALRDELENMLGVE